MQRELQIAWDCARSIESSPIGIKQMKNIGVIRNGNRAYYMFQDYNGAYWYQTKIKTVTGMMTEYEAVFGRKERGKWR